MVNALESPSVLQADATAVEVVKPGLARRIIRTRDLMTVVIDFTGGPWAVADPMHSHPHEQTTYIASGEILFLAAGQAPARLKAGDLFAVPSGVPHSIQLLSESARLVDTFNPIREDLIR